MRQTTLKTSTTIAGKGLHTGADVTVTIHPAEADTGYQLKRTDRPDQDAFRALPALVRQTTRGTVIGPEDHTISTVEHVLSALSGMSVDNALIEVDGPEMPILDGSALPIVQAIEKVGLTELEADTQPLIVQDIITFTDDDTGASYTITPAERFEVTVMVDYESSVISPQYAELKSLDQYKEEVAPSRTFVFLHELEPLLDMGLIKGGDLDNAIVIADRVPDASQLEHLAARLGKPEVEVVHQGILNTTKLRYTNEPARHKLLDVIGDLALVGAPIVGRIMATKPGHKSNVRLAKKLRELYISQQKTQGVPQYDPSATPIKDVNQIMAMLPHRYPFLLIDKITELSDGHVVGVKNITINEGYFQGHFPGNPVFPGVLQMEALAQTGGILALSTVPDPENWDTYFLKIDKAKFKMKVLPGDTLVLKMELLSPIRRGICHMQGVAYVNGRVASQGELTAQIVRRTVEE